MEVLPKRGGKAVILVISNRRVLCVRAYLSGGGSDSNGRNGNGGVRNGGGGFGGLRGSGIAGLDLEWEVQLDALVGLPEYEDYGGKCKLDFTDVIGVASGSTRRRDGRTSLRDNFQRGRMAGLAAVLGGGGVDDHGAGVLSHSHARGGQASNPGGVSGGGGGGGGGNTGGGRVLKSRMVQGFYRDTPALKRAFNVVACLTHQFGAVELSPGGMNVEGSRIVARSLLPPPGIASYAQIITTGAGGRRSRGGAVVVSINGWEFGEEPRDYTYPAPQAAGRTSFDASGSGLQRALTFSGFGSPRPASGNARGGGGGVEQPRVESLPRDLWMSLWLLMPQRNFAPPDKMRPVPNAFEMDVVAWVPGPIAPESDPGSAWLSAARVSALEAPSDLLRCV